MGEREAFDTFLECPNCRKQYPPDSGRTIDGVSYCNKCYGVLKPEEPKKVCESCGKRFSEATMSRHDGLLYCKKCFKALTATHVPSTVEQEQERARARTATQPASTPPVMPSSLAVTIDAPAIADAITRSVSQAFANPIRIEFAPVKLELVGGGTIAVPMQVPVPVAQATPVPVPVVYPPPSPAIAPAARGRPYVDASILRVMGAKRRKWRPAELAAELQLLDQPVDVTEEDVARSLERLARPDPDAKPEGQVVQLSTRYMRRDFFVVEDEVDFVDLLILKILQTTGSRGAPATSIHAAAELCNLVAVALPTVLNHLRALKATGWALVEKMGSGLRDNYSITDKGTGLLADAEDAALGSYTAEWRERLDRIGVFTPDNTLSEKADLLTMPVREVIVKHASKADKALIIAHMERRVDPAAKKAYGRKIVALGLLGF